MKDETEESMEKDGSFREVKVFTGQKNPKRAMLPVLVDFNGMSFVVWNSISVE